MHLEVNNDLELDIKNASTSRRNRKSKKSSSSPIKRDLKFSNKLKAPKRMSANPKRLTKKMFAKRSTAKKVAAPKSKPLMPSILINGKRVPQKAMKMSSSPKVKKVALFSASRKSASDSRRGAFQSRRKAYTSRREASSSRRKSSVSKRKASVSRRKASTSRRKASASRRKTSGSRRKASVSRRKASAARRRASASRRKASNARRKASDARRKAAFSRLRDAKGRFAKKGNEGAQTIYMSIQQASNGETAEAIVVSNEKDANKAGVTDVKIIEK